MRIFFKFLITLVLIITVSIGFNALASNNSTRMAVSGNILSPIVGEIAAKYDYRLLPFCDLTIPFNVQSIHLLPLPIETSGFLRSFYFGLYPNLTITTGAGARFHYPDSPWYVEPIVEIGYVRIDYAQPTGIQHHMMVKPKLMVGYYTVFDSGLYLNAGAGFAGRFFFPTGITTTAWQPDVTLALGYAW